MSNREDGEKNTSTRPSIKVSLPVELYYRRMRRLQGEVRQDNVATKEKEKDKKVEEDNSETQTNSQTQTNVSQEQKPLPIEHQPTIKPTPAYLGIPVGSFEAPRQIQPENYPWSTGRSRPYRHQHHAARVQRAQRFRDYNNNVTGQQQQRLMLGHRENLRRPSFNTDLPTTQCDD